MDKIRTIRTAPSGGECESLEILLTCPTKMIQSHVLGWSGLYGLSRATPKHLFFEKLIAMAEGTIKRLTDKGFGFIDTGTKQDMFFHSSNVVGTTFDQLREGQRVTYTEGRGPKGPRAENVKPA